jgi:hypothetical protein
MSELVLSRNAAGRLLLQDAAGSCEVTPVRAFPIAAPQQGIALLDAEGHERRWIARLDELPAATRELVEAELAQREFMPEILSIRTVSSFATPSRWQVGTDRGDTELLLKSEDHIRRLEGRMLLVTDGHGVGFLIRDSGKLDAHSRRLLDRFL